MSAPYFYEFLFRGFAEGNGAYHIVMRSETTDGFGQTVSSEKVYSMAQAEEAGITLPEAIGTINSQSLAEVDKLRADNTVLFKQVADLTETNNSLVAEVADLKAKLEREVLADPVSEPVAS